eukprot:1158677-Pelagomonas_calceolata.AAC.2
MQAIKHCLPTVLGLNQASQASETHRSTKHRSKGLAPHLISKVLCFPLYWLCTPHHRYSKNVETVRIFEICGRTSKLDSSAGGDWILTALPPPGPGLSSYMSWRMPSELLPSDVAPWVWDGMLG